MLSESTDFDSLGFAMSPILPTDSGAQAQQGGGDACARVSRLMVSPLFGVN